MTLTRFPSLLLFLFLGVAFTSCKESQDKQEAAAQPEKTSESQDLFFDISLAQWSLHIPLEAGELDPLDFAEKARELDIDAVEYVSSFYSTMANSSDNPEQALTDIIDTLKQRSEKFGVKNVLIMVDDEGALASPDEAERHSAVEKHKKWVDAAQVLGCHSIRVNLFGSTDPTEWKAASTDALTRLSEYAATKGINVLVENHGYLSSNSKLVTEVLEAVNLPNCGSLPDFGNFCLQREGGSLWDTKCIEEYPKYQGVEELMPYAFAVSAKTVDFDENGQEISTDFSRMLKFVKDAGYTGHIGIEYDGSRLSAEEGIAATKELLIKEGSKLSQDQ